MCSPQHEPHEEGVRRRRYQWAHGSPEPPSHLEEFLSLGIRQLEIWDNLTMAVPEGISQGEAISLSILFMNYGTRELAPAFNPAR